MPLQPLKQYVTTVYLFSHQGAFCGLVVGLFVGILRMTLEWSIPTPACGSGEENQQFDVVQNVHYLHFAIILALVTAFVNFTISMLTEPRTPAQVGFLLLINHMMSSDQSNHIILLNF